MMLLKKTTSISFHSLTHFVVQIENLAKTLMVYVSPTFIILIPFPKVQATVQVLRMYVKLLNIIESTQFSTTQLSIQEKRDKIQNVISDSTRESISESGTNLIFLFLLRQRVKDPTNLS